MNSRERIAAACAHTEPDKLPVDFGGGFQTGIHVSMVYKAAAGAGSGPARHARQGRRDLPDARRDRARPAGGARRRYGEPARHRDDVRLPADGVQGMAAGRWHAGAGAGGFQHASTSRTATCSSGPRTTVRVPPSGRMPAGGHFFDAIIRQEPIDESRLDPADNTEEFKPVARRRARALPRVWPSASPRRRTRRCSAPSAD